jgi:Flp pilus assembly protein TadD
MTRRWVVAESGILVLLLVLAGCSQNKVQTNHRQLTNFSPDAQQRARRPAARRPEPIPEPVSATPTVQGAMAMARLSERRGQPEQAEQLYRVVVQREPNNPAPHHRLGVICAKRGDFTKSESHFRKACELQPTNPELINDIGYSYYLQNRLEQAEKILRRARELAPDDPAICNNLGIVLGEQGRYEESVSLFLRAGDEAQALANLAFMYAQHGELHKAQTCYSRALSLDGDLRPAAEAMVQLARYTPSHESTPQETAPAPTQEPVAPALASKPQPLDVPIAETPQPVREPRQQASRLPVEGPDSVQPASFEECYPSTGADYPEVSIVEIRNRDFREPSPDAAARPAGR